jgi:Na+/H+-dicarboxylate symporter
MMKKIALHWQILIALIVAIIYGIVFSTSYKVDEPSVEKLEQRNVPEEVLSSFESLTGKEYVTLESFQEAIRDVLTKEAYKTYYPVIEDAAYHNPPVYYISWIGEMFLRALRMLIIPLILSSLISGVANIGSGKNLGRLGLKTMGYYVMTSVFAIMTGLVLVNVIQPGKGADLNFSKAVEGLVEEQRNLREIIIEIVPSNIFEAFMTSDMLSIIFFAMLVGFFITRTSAKSKALLTDFFNAFFDVMMKITMFIIRFTPIGIFGIVTKVVADQDDLLGLMGRMGIYMGTVIGALLIHAFIVLPLLVRIVGKANPLKHFNNMSAPLMTAFSTSSSGATLPLTMNAVEHNSGVSNKVTSFTLPLGATINMDGTALYECIAALFIAQAYGVDLTIAAQFTVVITALLASIGAAAIPMAGLVMITVILTAVGLPLEGVGLILAVDRILDMFRTATNVWSDTCGAVIIAKSEGEETTVGQ